MKKFLFSLLVLSTMSFVACKKEVTFDDKLIGEWTSTSVKVAGSDVTNTNTVVLVIQTSREFDADITTAPLFGQPVTSSYTGDWAADELKQELVLKYSTGQEEKYDISSITETSMRATTVVDNVRREFVFEKSTQQ
jgi:hypothetical protein